MIRRWIILKLEQRSEPSLAVLSLTRTRNLIPLRLVRCVLRPDGRDGQDQKQSDISHHREMYQVYL